MSDKKIVDDYYLQTEQSQSTNTSDTEVQKKPKLQIK